MAKSEFPAQTSNKTCLKLLLRDVGHPIPSFVLYIVLISYGIGVVHTLSYLLFNVASDLLCCRGMCGKKLILSCTEPRFDYVDLFIIDFARKPISESDFYYYNMFDTARLD